MAGIQARQRFVEKFFCHCGKVTKSVKIHTKGMFWRCEDGHVERHWFRKSREEKR